MPQYNYFDFLYKMEILCSIELLLHDNKQKLVEWKESPLYSASVLSINIILPYAIANSGFFWRQNEHTHTHTRICTQTHTHIRTQTHTHTTIRTQTHTHIRTQTHTHTHTYIHKHTHTHTYVHKHTHTHTHTHALHTDRIRNW